MYAARCIRNHFMSVLPWTGDLVKGEYVSKGEVHGWKMRGRGGEQCFKCPPSPLTPSFFSVTAFFLCPPGFAFVWMVLCRWRLCSDVTSYALSILSLSSVLLPFCLSVALCFVFETCSMLYPHKILNNLSGIVT